MILKDNHLFSVYNGTEGFELISGLKLILKNHKEQGDGRGGGGGGGLRSRIEYLKWLERMTIGCHKLRT